MFQGFRNSKGILFKVSIPYESDYELDLNLNLMEPPPKE